MSKTRYKMIKTTERNKGYFVTAYKPVVVYRGACRKWGWKQANKIFYNYNQ